MLGGTKVGNGAWALARVETIMQYDPQSDEAKIAFEREKMWRHAEATGTSIDLTV